MTDSLEDVVSFERVPNDEFEIIWHNLCYTVTTNTLFGRKLSEKFVLKTLNGRVKSGQLVALMGPSGAGKSTLLECIIGKRSKGRSGEAFVRGQIADTGQLKVAFIPQQDCFINLLTVRETITFSSKFQNSTRQVNGNLDHVLSSSGQFVSPDSSSYHEAVVDNIIDRLGLKVCEHNRISNCSGGQQKRVSIAQELVARPSILILDEPTSGLDSASCLQVVKLLQELTTDKEPIAIIATIHQPSQHVFELFHKIYLLGAFGKCVYEGPPGSVAEHFKAFGLEMPDFYNPADYIIEAATGEYGLEALDTLVENHDSDFISNYLEVVTSTIPMRPFVELRSDLERHPVIRHILYHSHRSLIMTVRDPLVFVLRFALSFIVAAFIGLLFGPMGERGGCPPSIGGDFVPSDLDNATEHIKAELEANYNNVGSQFFSILFMLFNALLPTCMTFPAEMHVFIKERNNAWYRIPSYYLGKLVAEVPFQIALPPIYVAIVWLMTKQVAEWWRYLNYTAIMIVISFTGQSLGHIIGAVYMDNLSAAVYIAPLSCIPFMLISGIFVKVSSMPVYMQWMTWASYIRFGIEGLLITMYGFNRCGSDASTRLLEAKEGLIVWLGAMLGTFNEDTTPSGNVSSDYVTEGKVSLQFVESLVDTLAGKFISDDGIVQSAVLNLLRLYDRDLLLSWIGLVVLLIGKRVIAYYIISYKANKSN